jgi:membrane associated rhomboid family serine protease
MIPLKDDQESRSFPFVTLLLIAANVYVFVAWQSSMGVQQSVDRAGFIPSELTSHASGGWTHVFTGMFMHGGWAHLLGNMWFLWVFGQRIEQTCGHFAYVPFYLLCGVASTLAYTVVSPTSELPLVGASGAISGVLGAYLLHYPHAQVVSLVMFGPIPRIVRVPGWLFLLFWIGWQVLFQYLASQKHNDHTGGVAYAAHIGGFIAGMGLIIFFEKAPERARNH